MNHKSVSSNPVNYFHIDHGYTKICPKCLKRYGQPTLGVREVSIVYCFGCAESEKNKTAKSRGKKC